MDSLTEAYSSDQAPIAAEAHKNSPPIHIMIDAYVMPCHILVLPTTSTPWGKFPSIGDITEVSEYNRLHITAMKMISTLAILIGSINISLLFTTLYNVKEWPPIACIILSTAYIGVMLLMEWEYRRFRIIKPESVAETATLFHMYIYLFAVGVIVALIKYITYLNESSTELYFEKYMLVKCFDEKNNSYFSLLYYVSNYLLGIIYLKMFRELFNKYKNKLIERVNLTILSEAIVCAICMNDIRAGLRIAQLDCLHQFHQSCLKKWVMQRNICPVCKCNINGTEQQCDQALVGALA